MYKINVFPDRALGPIRELNGVGGGPVTNHFVYDSTEDFIEAGIPLCRTHDIEYPFGAGEFVDIHCIFKDFDKDENDPASYNFTFTDEYFKAIVNAGAKPFYRLGATIEHQPIKLYIHPPKDLEKWGRICSHIVAHYNDGWADGFHMGIEYWEIWNEPDIPMCWTGTTEQFIDLYAAAAPIIKREHPDVKVGGCAFAMPEGVFAEKWLAAVRDRGLPLDFFSWHLYPTVPYQVAERSGVVDALLEKYGFGGVESIFNEWNYVCRWDTRLQECYDLHKKPFECAFMAGVLSVLQDSRVNKAMYYDVQMLMNGSWNGVFAPTAEGAHASARRPARLPGYYALKYWNELKKRGTQVETASECPDIYATAARGENGELAVLVSYFNDEAKWNQAPPPDADFRFGIPGARKLTAYIVDDERVNEPVELTDGVLRMKGNSCALVVCQV
ncbi:MAG: hypothetical protein IK118_04145 [Clostridia bacterium]|nr:hypothetical protein [Clostridia bacterium]